MPIVWTVINLIIVGIMIVSALIISFFVQGFRIFLGFSISTWLFALLLGVYAFSEITSSVKESDTKPVFYSPWIFPAYVYIPKKNDVESCNKTATAMVAAFIVLIGWSVLASVWFSPSHVGVSLSILFEIALILAVLFLV